METLTAAQVLGMRVRAQGLAGAPARSVVEAVRRAGALQAQDVRACRLQARVRSTGLTAGDWDAACAGRAVVRTWLMRGTLHAVPAEDVRWMTALLGPRNARSARVRRLRLGLDDAACSQGLAGLEKVLAGGPPLLRDDLVERLAGHGLRLDPRSQAPAHLLAYAAALGLVCRGPEAAGNKATYVLREEWLAGAGAAGGSGPAGDEAVAELAARHIAAYGPVTEADFARWSGLPLGQARAGFAAVRDRLVEVLTPDGPMWVTAGAEPGGAGPAVRLTGAWDPYLLGYRDRGLALDPRFAGRVADGGTLAPCVLLDGEVVGTWRRGPGGGVAVEAFGKLPPRAAAGIEAEEADLARFLGTARG